MLLLLGVSLNVELRGLDRAKLYPTMSESEWEDRLELAALGRILYMYGFGSDLAAQCVMARLRSEPDTMLMNEWRWMELKAFETSRLRSTQSGWASRVARTVWATKSRPDRQATPTWIGHGEPSA